MKDNDPIEAWIDKERVDNFVLITPKYSKQTMSRRQYSFVESIDPENIFKGNKNIPLFVFEYFVQKHISGVIEKL